MTQFENMCIIDDDLIFVLITKKILQRHDFCKNLITYKNGRQAFNGLSHKISSGELIPEIILLDLNMPHMNGWEFLNQLSETLYKHNISVFIISSSVDQSDLDKCNLYKCVLNYIIKPLFEEDLYQLIKEYDENK